MKNIMLTSAAMAAAAILGFGAPAFGQTTVSVFAPPTNADPSV